MEKLTTQIGFWKIAFGWRKVSDSTDLRRKKYPKKTLMTPQEAECFFILMAIWQGLESHRGDAIGMRLKVQHPSYPSSRRQALSYVMWRIERWALRCLLLIFKPTITEKAKSHSCRLSPCFLRRKRAFWKCYIREINPRKPYVFGR